MRSTAYDFKGFYTIVIYDEFNFEIVNRILGDCWKLYISNVEILVPSKTFDTVHVYTYYPYGPDYCELVKPFEQDVFINNTFARNSQIFPEKFNNFYKCPLTLATYDFRPHMMLAPIENGSFILDGLDGITFRVISQRLNFTPIVKMASTNVLKKVKNKNETKSKLKPSLDMVKKLFICITHYK